MSAAAALRASTRGRGRSALQKLLGQPMAAAGFAIVAVFVLAAAAAPILPLADPDATLPANRLAQPFSPGHLFGTDQLGRDMLSRVVWGLRVSLAVGAAATLSAALVGAAIGLVAAFYGRLVGPALMRLVDVLMAFPYLLLALAVVAALGPGLVNAGLAIAVVNVPFFARSVRGAALGIVSSDYVAAARLAGFSDLRILLTEILPNVAPLLIVTAATTIGWMILETAGLSFLGLGAQPPQADLGSMLGDGRKVVAAAPHVAAIPGLVTFVLVVGLNLLGDGLRDLLDPRMKGGQGGAPAPTTAVERVAFSSPLHGGESSIGAAERVRGLELCPGRAGPPHPALRADLSPPGRGEGKSACDPRAATLVLDIRNLTVAFDTPTGRHAAVRDVSFTVAPGEALGIVGESGSGKSVAALSLTRLAPTPPGTIFAGEVALAGEDLLALPFEALRDLRGDRLAYVFQDPLTTLNPLMRIGGQISEALRAEGGDDIQARVRVLLDEVGLPDPERIARSYPHQLSGGQRQRVGIAMALANRPDVLVADEPTTALDAVTQGRVVDLFARSRRETGAALVFVSHNFGNIAGLCDRVAVMYAGEIVEEGPTAEVLGRPRHPYTERLIACAPRLGEPDRVLAAIPGAPPPIDARPLGCAFAPRCPLVVDTCREGPIALERVGTGWASRCIRWKDVSRG